MYLYVLHVIDFLIEMYGTGSLLQMLHSDWLCYWYLLIDKNNDHSFY